MPSFVTDNDILWLKVPKKGSPAEWEPGKIYRVGDIVIPTSAVTIPSGEEDFMFQCVGFVGKSAGSAPSWPTSTNVKFLSGNVEFASRDPNLDPAQVGATEYYWIKRNITVSNS